MLTDLKVGKYYGELGVDYWDAAEWKLQKDENEVCLTSLSVVDLFNLSLIYLICINHDSCICGLLFEVVEILVIKLLKEILLNCNVVNDF